MQAGQGIGEEFTFIIAAVVGGCLLTGGYGSAIGASIGASIIGMAVHRHRVRRLEHRLDLAVPRRDPLRRGPGQHLHQASGRQGAKK
jgi:hypothetical protein